MVWSLQQEHNSAGLFPSAAHCQIPSISIGNSCSFWQLQNFTSYPYFVFFTNSTGSHGTALGVAYNYIIPYKNTKTSTWCYKMLEPMNTEGKHSRTASYICQEGFREHLKKKRVQDVQKGGVQHMWQVHLERLWQTCRIRLRWYWKGEALHVQTVAGCWHKGRRIHFDL